MRMLLDTHTFLWFVLNDVKLAASAKTIIEAPTSDVLISPASFWEIAIKVGKKKLDLLTTYDDFMHKGIVGNGFQVLPIETKHTSRLTTLPMQLHKDPFDRLLVAQSLVDGIPLVSDDLALDAYGIQRLW